MSKIRVLIVEDSRAIREFLTHIIDRDPRLQVVAAYGSAEEALRELHRVAPDVISMDIRLPGMNGFDATKRIMAERPTPIVVVSASVEAEDLKISMNALRAGALAVVEKPVGASHADYERLAERICTQLAIMSQVRVIRQRARRRGELGQASAPAATAKSPAVSPANYQGTIRAVALVASTGGPSALVSVLEALPASFPLPVLVVQHITASFHKGFVAWLGDNCPLGVVEATDGQTPRPGTVHVAPAEKHLQLIGGVLRLDSGPPVCMQRPSGSVLFQSMACGLGSQALGVLLTGMGEDGAEGLRELRAAGGYTIAEDESTAVVYGMPAAAVRLGGVSESLPLPEIGPRIVELTTTTSGGP
jgi:two-component system chemotaxis response regulator CheB